MKKLIYLILSFTVLAAACNKSNQEQAAENTDVVEDSIPEIVAPTTFINGINAHGGLSIWKSFNTLNYELENMTSGNKQQQFIDLYTRKVRITDSLFVLGYDGDQVWVSPDLAAFGKGSARFYHNLYFYFFAMPYALADPGIQYEDLGQRTIDSTTYNAVKVSYDQGVGDSPEDFYIAHFNRETGLMEVLLYTVTYYSKESHDKYNALLYEWQEVNGIQVTKSITGYKYDSGRLGDLRYQSQFNNVTFSQEKPDESLFSIPEIAEIDSLK